MTVIKKVLPNWPAPDHIHAFVTERSGGCSVGSFASLNLAGHVNDSESAVARNRDQVRSALPDNLAYQWLDQVHSNIVNTVNIPTSPMRGDSLICRLPGVICCVLTADCLPIFLTNREGTEIAILHAGWRGICYGIINNTIDAMHSRPSDILAWLGPAIGPCHYEVGIDLKNVFKGAIGSKELWLEIERCFGQGRREDKLYLNLYRAAEVILGYSGVNEVFGGNQCTFCEEEKYYSYRRDQETGRMLSAIFIEPECCS